MSTAGKLWLRAKSEGEQTRVRAPAGSREQGPKGSYPRVLCHRLMGWVWLIQDPPRVKGHRKEIVLCFSEAYLNPVLLGRHQIWDRMRLRDKWGTAFPLRDTGEDIIMASHY